LKLTDKSSLLEYGYYSQKKW